MIDVAAVSLALRQDRYNALNQNIKIRGRRHLLFVATALTLLAGGWFSVHHMTGFAFLMGMAVFSGMLGVALFDRFPAPGSHVPPRTPEKRITGRATAHRPVMEPTP